jgi:hypothetical protein
MRAGLVAIVTLAFVAPALAPARAAAATPVTIGGRVVFRDATREARSQDVERLRWGHITVELHHGWQVFAARPDENGLFAITGPPGTYRIEYVRVGEQAEFFPPHEVEASPGRFTCIGTLEITVKDMSQDLGQNTGSALRVRPDCAEFDSALRQLGRGAGAPNAASAGDDAGGEASGGSLRISLARPIPPETYAPSPMDVLVGLRAEFDFTSQYLTALRANLVVPVTEDNGHGNWIVGGSVVRVPAKFINSRWTVAGVDTPLTGAAWGGTVAAGYSIWAIEVEAFGGYLGGLARGPSGPSLGGTLRFGTILFGITGRVEEYLGRGGQLATLNLDISPIGILGALL